MMPDYEDFAAAPASPAEDAEGGIAHRQFVLFLVGAEQYAAAVETVQEIIRIPRVVPVPWAPPALEGLANLRGQILPIVSLRRIFRLPERDYDDAARAVVVNLGHPVGCTVDRVTSVVTVPADAIEPAAALEGAVQAEWLSGLIKDAAGRGVAMVLDMAKVLIQTFGTGHDRAESSHPAQAAGFSGDDRTDPSDESQAIDELQLVSFDIDGQEYAVAIEDVQEIVQMPEHVVQIPHAPPSLLGVMTLRYRLLPLVSLRRLFELPDAAQAALGRVVVLSTGDVAMGMVTDNVREVLRVPKSCVEPLPALLRETGAWNDIAAICRLDQGTRLVLILSVEQLFRQTRIREALSQMESRETSNPNPRANNPMASESADDEVQVVVFRLEQEEFGVPIDAVQEIVRMPEHLIRIPQAPPFVEGVINLRGTVLPVVDLRRRLGLRAVPRSDRQRVMVFCMDRQRTGFIVDSVSEVLKIPAAAIQPAPRMTENQARLLPRVANLEAAGRIIQLSDPAPLVESHGLPEGIQTMESDAVSAAEGDEPASDA